MNVENSKMVVIDYASGPVGIIFDEDWRAKNKQNPATNKMQIQATCARVIIKADEEHAGSKLHVPDAAKRPTDRGTVTSVGPGRRHIDGQVYPLTIKVGDRVLFSRMGAFGFKEGSEQFFVMEEEQVIGLLRQ